MRILVTGTQGQLARALVDATAHRPDIELIALGRPQIDLAEPDRIASVLAAHRPDLVINAAAYTAVDQAEDEPELAHAINATGAGAVAAATAAIDAPVIQLSTDYVFDGRADRAYREDDPVAPLGVYGRSKLAGEHLVAAANPRHLIVRTAWVYSPFGRNFLKTMLHLAESRDEISVVCDQIGNPSSAQAIADGLLAMANRLASQPDFAGWGTYHLVGGGEASWAGFAEEIFRISQSLGGPSARVRPIPTSDYPTKARRPANSRLDCSRLNDQFDWRAPDWRVSLAETMRHPIPS